jgi:hypothetical protein
MYVLSPIRDLPLNFQRTFSTSNLHSSKKETSKAEDRADQIIDVVANEELHAPCDARSLKHQDQPYRSKSVASLSLTLLPPPTP